MSTKKIIEDDPYYNKIRYGNWRAKAFIVGTLGRCPQRCLTVANF